MYIKLIKDERIALITEKNEKLIKRFLEDGFILFTEEKEEKDNSENIKINDNITNEEVKKTVKRGRKNKDVNNG